MHARTYVFSRSVLLLRNQPPWGAKGKTTGYFRSYLTQEKLSICCVLEHTVCASVPNAADYGGRAFRDGRTDTLGGKHGTLTLTQKLATASRRCSQESGKRALAFLFCLISDGLILAKVNQSANVCV